VDRQINKYKIDIYIILYCRQKSIFFNILFIYLFLLLMLIEYFNYTTQNYLFIIISNVNIVMIMNYM
jgi:hypothetical protein